MKGAANLWGENRAASLARQGRWTIARQDRWTSVALGNFCLKFHDQSAAPHFEHRRPADARALDDAEKLV
jgi:hypothetical protein